jgi:succinate dehydrogenase / fumarate reductase flavoprotein subunit
LRLMSESARGEGGRVWTYKDGKPWYFLEEKYPEYGNLVPRDIATREIFHVCVDEKLGLDGENMVYLDVSHIPASVLNVKLGGILEIYEKFVGDDPRKVPMRIFPAVHYSMGGLWVDYDQMTNIPGLFACGECDYQYHGANRLGANSLLSSIYGGMITGPSALRYAQGLKKAADGVPATVYTDAVKREQEKYDRILHLSGTENPYQLGRELGQWMTDNVTVVRYNDRLKQTDAKIQELMERYQKINMADTSAWQNQMAPYTRQLWNMFELARVMTIGALLRDESRGAHYKPDFPQRDDERFLKTTIAKWSPEGPNISYEDVDVSLIRPRERRYDIAKEATV